MSVLLNQRIKANELYQRAEKQWADGKPRAAFRLFLAAAKLGFVPAFEIVAHFYDNGTGVKTNADAALHWYERMYRNGHSWYREAHRQALSAAANNIGCILRDRQEQKRAILWFQRAAKLGDGDANLNIAKIYLRHEGSRRNAIRYLQKIRKAPWVTDGSIEEAKTLLEQIRSKKLRPDEKLD